MLGLLAGDRAEDPGGHPAGRCSEVDGSGLHGVGGDAAPVGQLDVLLQLDDGAGEPVGVPDDDDGGLALVEVGEHPPVVLAEFPGERGHVVVDVHLDDIPAVSFGEGFAVLALPVDAEAGAGAVLGDTHVDDGARPAVPRWSGLHDVSVPQ